MSVLKYLSLLAVPFVLYLCVQVCVRLSVCESFKYISNVS